MQETSTPWEVAEPAGVVYHVTRWSDAAAIYERIVVEDPAAPDLRGPT